MDFNRITDQPNGKLHVPENVENDKNNYAVKFPFQYRQIWRASKTTKDPSSVIYPLKCIETNWKKSPTFLLGRLRFLFISLSPRRFFLEENEPIHKPKKKRHSAREKVWGVQKQGVTAAWHATPVSQQSNVWCFLHRTMYSIKLTEIHLKLKRTY